MRVRMPVWAVLLGGLCAAGCDDAPTVKGRITSRGKPVVWGSVTLVDSHGGYHQALIDLNGNYVVEGVPSGAVKVGVVSDNPTPRGGRVATVGKATAGTQDPREALGFRQDTGPDLPKPPPGAWFPIPDRYGDPHSSGLTGEVKPGRESELNIDLK